MGRTRSVRNMDTATLRSLVMIADLGNMTRAASRLHMTQSAVSMQIKRLEEALEVTVFERSARGAQLTPQGEQLLQYARSIIRLNDDAFGRLTSPEYEGQVRLGVPDDIVYPRLPPLIRRFGESFPRVDLQLSTANTHILKNRYERGELDIALTTETDEDTRGQILRRRNLVWVGAENSSAWRRQPIPVGFSKSCVFRDLALKALEKAGLSWVDAVSTEDDIVVTILRNADLCIGAALESSSYFHQTEIAHQGGLPVLPVIAISMYVDDGNPIASVLAEQIVEAYR